MPRDLGGDFRLALRRLVDKIDLLAIDESFRGERLLDAVAGGVERRVFHDCGDGDGDIGCERRRLGSGHRQREQELTHDPSGVLSPDRPPGVDLKDDFLAA